MSKEKNQIKIIGVGEIIRRGWLVRDFNMIKV